MIEGVFVASARVFRTCAQYDRDAHTTPDADLKRGRKPVAGARPFVIDNRCEIRSQVIVLPYANTQAAADGESAA